MSKKPVLGSIVIYVDSDGDYRAAIVSKIIADTTVRLHVLEDYGINVVLQVGYIAKPTSNSWHWPNS